MAKFCLRSPKPRSRMPRTDSEGVRRGAVQLKGIGGKRGPPERCDTYNPTAAKKAPPLPGDHDQLYQVAISQSPLSPHPDGPEPLRGSRVRPWVVGPRAIGYPRNDGRRRRLPSPRRTRLCSQRTPIRLAGTRTLQAGVVSLYGVVVILGRWVRVGCARLRGVHSEPPSSVGRAPGCW
jgi:hypothetical protein